MQYAQKIEELLDLKKIARESFGIRKKRELG